MKSLLGLATLLLSTPAWSEPPLSVRKQVAEEAAGDLLRDCSATDDVKQCLVYRGAECNDVGAKTGNEFRCVMQITLDGTSMSGRSQPAKTSDKFDVTYRVYMTKKGWKGSIYSIVLADN